MVICVLGDSIALGLGVKGNPFASILAYKLEKYTGNPVQVHNLAKNGGQITESIQRLTDQILKNTDYLIVAHGVTEAILRPKPNAMKWMPIRWRTPGWMDPRPYYSSQIWKRILQHTESSVRWRVKNLLMRMWGSAPWMEVEDFKKEIEDLTFRALESGTKHVIFMGGSWIDERFFPGSQSSLDRYATAVNEFVETCDATDRVHFCNPRSALLKWADYFPDHFHPSHSGHEKIAIELFKVLHTTITNTSSSLESRR